MQAFEMEHTYIKTRLASERSALGNARVVQTDLRWRRVYALGCWLALESLHDRLVKGNALLCQMRDNEEQGTKRFDRLSIAWLKLGFRSIGLISRMGRADSEIEAQFCASPTGRYFAAEPWPDIPTGIDIEPMLARPAQLTFGTVQ